MNCASEAPRSGTAIQSVQHYEIPLTVGTPTRTQTRRKVGLPDARRIGLLVRAWPADREGAHRRRAALRTGRHPPGDRRRLQHGRGALSVETPGQPVRKSRPAGCHGRSRRALQSEHAKRASDAPVGLFGGARPGRIPDPAGLAARQNAVPSGKRGAECVLLRWWCGGGHSVEADDVSEDVEHNPADAPQEDTATW